MYNSLLSRFLCNFIHLRKLQEAQNNSSRNEVPDNFTFITAVKPSKWMSNIFSFSTTVLQRMLGDLQRVINGLCIPG